MRSKLFRQLLFAALVSLCAVVAAVAPASAQEAAGQPTPTPAPQQPAQGEEGLTRGAFLTTRPKTTANKKASGEAGAAIKTPEKNNEPTVTASNASSNNSKKSVAKTSGNNKSKKNAGRTTTASTAPKSEKPSGGVNPPSGVIQTGVNSSPAVAPKLRPIGLGYTLFTLGDNGEAVRTDPARQFRTGEAIRLSLESNTDGYLYIFHTENDGEPSMIFPDARLNGGKNFVSAHVPYEIPSSQEASEETRWLVFKDPPAAERLYVVLTRQPLAGVPSGEALANYCFDAQHTCPWRPVAAMWTELKAAQEREQVAVSRVQDQGRAQTSDEREATTRGLGLAAGAPSPSIIRMTASADSKMLVTAIDLIHK